MHIVFLSSEYPLWSPGGFGSFLQTFGRLLVKNGHAVTILGIGIDTNMKFMEDEGVQIYRLPKNRSKLPNFVAASFAINKELKRIHSKKTIDIIETAEGGLAFISKKTPAKKVIRLHGGHHFFAEAERRGINWRKGLLEKMSFRKADGFIAVSNYVKTHTAKYLDYHNKPVAVINHPLDTSRTIVSVEVKDNHILFAGTVCEKKGARQLLEAFKIVREKYPNKILDIYGRDWFYPNGESYIENLRKQYDASYFENVNFHGTILREELYVKYSESSFCVFPSHMETQGLVVLEAMLLARPVIFSQYGPGPETIAHKVTGLLCNVLDPQDIANNMIYMIENPDAANQMGTDARKEVMTKYDENTILEQNIHFYNKLIHSA